MKVYIVTDDRGILCVCNDREKADTLYKQKVKEAEYHLLNAGYDASGVKYKFKIEEWSVI